MIKSNINDSQKTDKNYSQEDILFEMINKLKIKIKTMFAKDKTGHNIDHLERTMNIAINLQAKEGGNLRVIAISALLHDIHRIMTDNQRDFVQPKDSLPVVRELLEDIDLTQEEKEHICYAIEHHEEYSFGGGSVTVTDIESKILQDADNIDCSGAIGIARTFTFGSAHNIPFYTTEYPLVKSKYKESGDFDPSTIHHCVNKIMRLDETMNTKSAKKMCIERGKFVKTFVEQFIDEWNGKK